jgi:hypothetical protein
VNVDGTCYLGYINAGPGICTIMDFPHVMATNITLVREFLVGLEPL